jgi:nitrogen fixation NifU-like protein
MHVFAQEGILVDRQAYVENIVDHFEHPRNKGRLDNADIQLGGGNPGCGDLITLYLKVAEDDHIADLRFEGEGCTISQAGGSIISEVAKGLTLDEVMELGLETMTDEMGDEIVRSRVRCATLALGTLQAAVEQYRQDRARREAGLPPIERKAFEV